MRHKRTFNHLGRNSAHRKAMLANMASSLIRHKRIETTTAKAKALRGYIEPLITRSREDSTHSRRVVFSYLQDKEAVSELFREVAPKVGDRPGGYTRIIKLGGRLGDNADMCLIELVDYNENLLADKAASKKSASRRRRGGKKKAEEAVQAVAETGAEVTEVPEVHEEPAAEAQPEAEAEVETEVETEAEALPEAETETEAVAETAAVEEVAEEPVAEAQAADMEEVKEEEEPKEDKEEDPEKKES